MNGQHIDFHTKDEINTLLGGLSFIKCTQAEYDAMTEHDENTVYIIIEEVSE